MYFLLPQMRDKTSNNNRTNRSKPEAAVRISIWASVWVSTTFPLHYGVPTLSPLSVFRWMPRDDVCSGVCVCETHSHLICSSTNRQIKMCARCGDKNAHTQIKTYAWMWDRRDQGWMDDDTHSKHQSPLAIIRNSPKNGCCHWRSYNLFMYILV